MHLNGENKLNVLKWVETRDEHAKVLKIYVHENIKSPGVCLLLPGGYIHAYTKLFKHLCNRMADQSQA